MTLLLLYHIKTPMLSISEKLGEDFGQGDRKSSGDFG